LVQGESIGGGRAKGGSPRRAVDGDKLSGGWELDGGGLWFAGEPGASGKLAKWLAQQEDDRARRSMVTSAEGDGSTEKSVAWL
jgi:hypothetical protein